MEYVLETNGLSKRYRAFMALNGLNMHIPKGSIYGFVGRNGAGKTTLIRLICGLQEPTSGSFSCMERRTQTRKSSVQDAGWARWGKDRRSTRT